MSGIQLARRFYEQAVVPLVGDVPHAAGLLGDGSEVLGFDDGVSTDHDFGPRVQVFVAKERDLGSVRGALQGLPEAFEGWPVGYPGVGRPSEAGGHHVEVTTVARFFVERIGCDPAQGMGLADWLTTPTQRLATLVGGGVFRDDDGALEARRRVLAWYPEDVWRYVLAAAWLRVSQEEAFVGRTGSVGDELGSALVAGRVARDLMRITFLVERRWAPYGKWLGTAFARLPLAGRVGPHLSAAVRADDWRARETALCAAQRELAVATNRLGLADEVDPEPRPFYDRDIRVLFGDRFTNALAARVTDPGIRALITRLGARHHDASAMLPGAIDQVVDSVDVLQHPDRCRNAAAVLGLPDEGER